MKTMLLPANPKYPTFAEFVAQDPRLSGLANGETREIVPNHPPVETRFLRYSDALSTGGWEFNWLRSSPSPMRGIGYGNGVSALETDPTFILERAGKGVLPDIWRVGNAYVCTSRAHRLITELDPGALESRPIICRLPNGQEAGIDLYMIDFIRKIDAIDWPGSRSWVRKAKRIDTVTADISKPILRVDVPRDVYIFRVVGSIDIFFSSDIVDRMAGAGFSGPAFFATSGQFKQLGEENEGGAV